MPGHSTIPECYAYPLQAGVPEPTLSVWQPISTLLPGVFQALGNGAEGPLSLRRNHGRASGEGNFSRYDELQVVALALHLNAGAFNPIGHFLLLPLPTCRSSGGGGVDKALLLFQ